MRLWHYDLIKFLPDPQLIAQWRELNLIFRNEKVNHILINYIYDYPDDDLKVYSVAVIKEMEKRGFKVNLTNFTKRFGMGGEIKVFPSDWKPFKDIHNNKYLLQCFMNLSEKYDRGQENFSRLRYETMQSFVFKKLLTDAGWCSCIEPKREA